MHSHAFFSMLLTLVILLAAPVVRGDDALSTADQRHLLVRTGIGAAPDELLALQGLTREQAIDHVLSGTRQTPQSPMPDWTRAPLPHYHARGDMPRDARRRFDIERDRELGELRAWWMHELLTSDSPQTERLVFFWHDLFATSYHGTDRQALAMARQNATFREHATGSWRAMLKAMIRDAALLNYLDNDRNRVEAPNENLARELLELFTLGEGNYTQSDVKEAARALTGYGRSDIARLAFRWNGWARDEGDKRLFGRGGVRDGDDVIDRILEQPAAARYLATRFWQAFIADGDPSPDWLDTAADAFRKSDYDIATLYRYTLSSSAFWSPDHRGAIVRSPLDLVVGTARSLDFPKQHWRQFSRWQADLGLDLLAPPDVAGWREGDAWIAGGALLDRQRVVSRLIDGEVIASATSSMMMELTTQYPEMQDSDMQDSEMQDSIIQGSDTQDPAMQPADMLKVDARDSELAQVLNVPHMSDGERSESDDMSLGVRIAAENYRGPVSFRVSLLGEGEIVWEGQPSRLGGGHDSERDGRLRDKTDMPWQLIRVPAPKERLASADAVRIEFLNDAAGVNGDRNLYVDGAFWGANWLAAADGRQQGACVPESPSDAGSLYCSGHVTLERTARIDAVERKASGVEADPDGSARAITASAVHVRWAKSETDRDLHVVRIALDDANTPAGHFHRLQFVLRTEQQEPVELQLNSYDCSPDCLPAWPDCAWSDEASPRDRTIRLPLNMDADSALNRCHFDSVPEAIRDTFRLIGRTLPTLFKALAKTESGRRAADTLAVMSARIDAQSGGDHQGVPAVSLQIDPSFAPPFPGPSLQRAPNVQMATVSELFDGLAASGLTPLDVLLAGFDDEALAPLLESEDGNAAALLTRIVRHPVFQVR